MNRVVAVATANTAATSGPICIIGMPRSGTTWLGKIFDSHPDTLYRHEPDSGPILRDLPLLANNQEPRHTEAMAVFLGGLRCRRSARICGKLPLFRKHYLAGWRGRLHRATVYLARAVPGASNLPILEPCVPRQPAPRIVWKSIESTGRAGLIAAAAPAARLILLVRHPCGQIDSTLRGESAHRFADTCASADDWGIFAQLAASPQGRRRGLGLDAFRAMAVDERLAWRWLLFNEKALEETSGSSHCLTVCYEDLCASPRAVATRLFHFAGLPWDGAVDDFITASTSGDDGSYYGVYRDPRAAANAWRERLPSVVQERIEHIIAGSAPAALFHPRVERPRALPS